MPTTDERRVQVTPGCWVRRLVWLGWFWISGVAAMALVALLLRVLMRAAGLSA